MFNNAPGGMNMATKILRISQVKQQIGLSRSTIYQRISKGLFPRPISLGLRAVGWLESDLEDWIAERIADTNGQIERDL